MNAKPLLVCVVLVWYCAPSQAQSDSQPRTAARYQCLPAVFHPSDIV